LLLERKLGNYRLPDNCAIVGTMNNSTAAGMHSILSAIRNRMNILEIEFNFDYWFTNNGGNKLHYLVASFLKTKSYYCQELESTGIEGFATPRAWTALSNEFNMYTDKELTSLASKLASMQVSKDAARAFQTHVVYVQAIDFTKLVTKRILVDLSKRDPIDSIIFSYIVNFIRTVQDGLYLFKLMDANLNTASSTFIGFVLGELYIKHTHAIELTDGLKFVINKLTNQPLYANDYANINATDFAKIVNTPIENIEQYLKLASEYLI